MPCGLHRLDIIRNRHSPHDGRRISSLQACLIMSALQTCCEWKQGLIVVSRRETLDGHNRGRECPFATRFIFKFNQIV